VLVAQHPENHLLQVLVTHAHRFGLGQPFLLRSPSASPAPNPLAVDDESVAAGHPYPPLEDLRALSRGVAVAVRLHAMELDLAPKMDREAFEAKVDGMMWYPRYPKLVPV